MPAGAADAGHAAFRFTKRDIFHKACAGLTGGADIGQSVDQQYPAQLLTAAAQHFHRHRPAAALTPRIFPLQQSPEVTAISIAGDCRHTQRVAYFDVLDLRFTVALYLFFIPEIFLGKTESVRQLRAALPTQHQTITKGFTGAGNTVLPMEIIPVSLNLSRWQRHPAADGFCRPFSKGSAGIFAPVLKIVITGDDNFYLRPACPQRLRHVGQVACRYGSHYASGGELAHRQCRGVTFGNHHLYRRFRR